MFGPMSTHQASKIVLSLYPKNAIRIGRIKTRLRLKSIPLTQWINAAIAEKLDRENPETNVPDSEYVPALVELSPAERYKLERLKAEQSALAASLAAFERPAVKDAPAMAEPPPPSVEAVPAVEAVEAVEAVPAVEAVEAAVNGEDADFWGEDEMDMDRAAAMLRRIRQR
jgi:hypothetical protein